MNPLGPCVSTWISSENIWFSDKSKLHMETHYVTIYTNLNKQNTHTTMPGVVYGLKLQ